MNDLVVRTPGSYGFVREVRLSRTGRTLSLDWWLDDGLGSWCYRPRRRRVPPARLEEVRDALARLPEEFERVGQPAWEEVEQIFTRL
jgi:hypothetical protein